MKIFVFAGLQHHYLKLRDLVRALQEKQHNVSWLTANNAINIDPPTDYLIRSGESFIHLFDYYDSDGVGHILAQLNTNPYIFGSFQPFWVGYSMREFAETWTAVHQLINLEQPDAMLILHENNFWGRIVALACETKGIPCYSFQEGMLRQSDQDKWNKQGLAADSSTTLFCWSENDRQQYLDAGITDEKLFVSGPCHLDKYHNRPPTTNKLVTLAMPLISHWKGNLVEDVQQLSDFCKRNNINLVVRFHPREVEHGHQLLKGIWYNKYDEYDPLPLIAQSSVVLVQHSTIALEAIGLGIPVVEYAPSASDEVEQSWHSHYKVAPIIDDYAGLQIILDEVRDVDENWVRYHIPIDGMACERVAMVIENEMSKLQR